MRAPRTPPGSATCDAAPNIALVKQWGLRDPSEGLPYNSSLSVTLDRLRTRTTVRFDVDLEEDRFMLNGVTTGGPPHAAVVRFLDRVRALADVAPRAGVSSTNNFQSASGLGGAASGFAALAGAATAAAGLSVDLRGLSRLARLGSGSACRSVFGGFVQWNVGRSRDGRDSFAQPLYDAGHWPELVDVVALVADAPERDVPSGDAMQASVRSSPRYGGRLRAVPGRLLRTRAAIRTRNGPALFREMIDECDQFREVCETTDPPFDYLTRTSREILECVRGLNANGDRWVAGYTHDAGAHIHIFTLQASASKIRQELARISGISRVLTLHPGSGVHFTTQPPRRPARAPGKPPARRS
ncbi:MAG: diphosphomevalonate decarboxylase [Thermoplasmata archaeon]|nr:diphosphomevalonate decarboxylase [Thermoplasmata archaeon]